MAISAVSTPLLACAKNGVPTEPCRQSSRPKTQDQWTVQPETNHCFRGNVHFLASRDDLRAGSGTRAHASAYGRAFSATCNRADDCAEYGAATDKLACACIRSEAIAAVL